MFDVLHNFEFMAIFDGLKKWNERKKEINKYYSARKNQLELGSSLTSRHGISGGS